MTWTCKARTRSCPASARPRKGWSWPSRRSASTPNPHLHIARERDAFQYDIFFLSAARTMTAQFLSNETSGALFTYVRCHVYLRAPLCPAAPLLPPRFLGLCSLLFFRSFLHRTLLGSTQCHWHTTQSNGCVGGVPSCLRWPFAWPLRVGVALTLELDVIQCT